MFSFECVNNKNCREMIIEPNKTDVYIENGLTRFLDYLIENNL